MAVTFTWYLQGLTPTEISYGDGDILQFADGSFNGPVYVGEWNDSTHVKTDAGTDKSSANTPNNNKFISQDGGGGGGSQADWGDGTEDLDQITSAEASLKINIADTSAFVVNDAIFFSYDGIDTADPLAGLSVKAAEVGDTNFTDAEGNASALSLTDQGSATSHDYFIVISKSPDTVGLKSDKLRFEATIQ